MSADLEEIARRTRWEYQDAKLKTSLLFRRYKRARDEEEELKKIAALAEADAFLREVAT